MVRRGLCTLLTGFALALASACASEAEGPRTDSGSAAETTRGSATRDTTGEGETRPAPGQDEPGEASPPAAGGPAVLVTDGAALAWLEGHGLSAGPVAFGTGDAAVASFAGSPGLAAIRAAIEADVASVRRDDSRAEPPRRRVRIRMRPGGGAPARAPTHWQLGRRTAQRGSPAAKSVTSSQRSSAGVR